MAFWSSSPLAISCFFYLVYKHQRQMLPDAVRGALSVAIDNIEEFSSIGADNSITATTQAFHYRLQLLKEFRLITSRRAHCPHCYHRFSAPRRGRKYTCPIHGRVIAVSIVELNAEALKDLGVFLGPANPQAAPPSVPLIDPAAPSPSIGSAVATHSIGSAYRPEAPVLSPPSPHQFGGRVPIQHPACEAVLREQRGPVKLRDAIAAEEKEREKKSPRVPKNSLSYVSELKISPLPDGWTVHENGWYMDPGGGPHPPWDPGISYPQPAWEVVLESQAITGDITKTGIAHHMHANPDVARRQNLSLLSQGGDVTTSANGVPNMGLPDMFDMNFDAPAPMVEMEEVRQIVNKGRQAGLAWEYLYNIKRPAEELVETKISELIYGPSWGEVADGEFGRLHEFGLSSNFVRCARAFNHNLTLEELSFAPPELRAAQVVSPYDNLVDWQHVFYGIAQIEDLLRVRIIPEVEARFSYYLLYLLGGDSKNRVLGNYDWVAQALETELSEEKRHAYSDLYPMLHVPAFAPVVRDVMERLSVQLDTHQWRVCLYGCLAHANALTIADIGRWVKGDEVLLPSSNASVPEGISDNSD